MSKNRNNRFRILETILTLALIFLVGYASYITYSIKPSDKGPVLGRSTAKNYVVLITDDVSSYSYDKFMQGLEARSKITDVVIETIEISDISNTKEIEDAFNVSRYSGVDGIMLKLSNNELATDYINEAIKNELKVITIGNDSLSSSRNSYVGTNKYNLGVITANNIARRTKDSISGQSVLVLLGNEYSSEGGASNNSYINGILSVANKDDNKNIKIDFKYTSSKNRAEIIIRDTLKEKDIDYIVVTDEIDSVRATKTLIDINKINSVSVIGSGDHPDILEYLDKGTIDLSIAQNHELMGEKALDIIVYLCSGETITSYTSIPFEILDKDRDGDLHER